VEAAKFWGVTVGRRETSVDGGASAHDIIIHQGASFDLEEREWGTYRNLKVGGTMGYVQHPIQVWAQVMTSVKRSVTEDIRGLRAKKRCSRMKLIWTITPHSCQGCTTGGTGKRKPGVARCCIWLEREKKGTRRLYPKNHRRFEEMETSYLGLLKKQKGWKDAPFLFQGKRKTGGKDPLGEKKLRQAPC